MSTKRSVFALVLSLLAIVPAAAIRVPQTRQDFVQAVADGKGTTAVETIHSDQPLRLVYALLQEKVNTCLDVKVQRTAYVGYVERSSTDDDPTLRLVGKDQAEFTLQVEHNPRGVGPHLLRAASSTWPPISDRSMVELRSFCIGLPWESKGSSRA